MEHLSVASLVPSPFYFCARASIAARTFAGDIGNMVNRVPTARSIALRWLPLVGKY
jgi:hypothetical protein